MVTEKCVQIRCIKQVCPNVWLENNVADFNVSASVLHVRSEKCDRTCDVRSVSRLLTLNKYVYCSRHCSPDLLSDLNKACIFCCPIFFSLVFCVFYTLSIAGFEQASATRKRILEYRKKHARIPHLLPQSGICKKKNVWMYPFSPTMIMVPKLCGDPHSPQENSMQI